MLKREVCFRGDGVLGLLDPASPSLVSAAGGGGAALARGGKDGTDTGDGAGEPFFCVGIYRRCAGGGGTGSGGGVGGGPGVTGSSVAGRDGGASNGGDDCSGDGAAGDYVGGGGGSSFRIDGLTNDTTANGAAPVTRDRTLTAQTTIATATTTVGARTTTTRMVRQPRRRDDRPTKEGAHRERETWDDDFGSPDGGSDPRP